MLSVMEGGLVGPKSVPHPSVDISRESLLPDDFSIVFFNTIFVYLIYLYLNKFSLHRKLLAVNAF